MHVHVYYYVSFCVGFSFYALCVLCVDVFLLRCVAFRIYCVTCAFPIYRTYYLPFYMCLTLCMFMCCSRGVISFHRLCVSIYVSGVPLRCKVSCLSMW